MGLNSAFEGRPHQRWLQIALLAVRSPLAVGPEKAVVDKSWKLADIEMIS